MGDAPGSPRLDKLLRSRSYPRLFQWMTVAAFAAIVLTALFGPNNAGQNFGTALTWTLWWPLLPLSLLLLGRTWCAVCPFAWLMNRVQKAVGLRLPAPAALRRFGPWIIGALFVLITFVDETWAVSGDPRATGYLLLAVLAIVVAFAAFFDRQTFCRDVCFIGGFAANYARAGMIRLRTSPDRCAGCAAQPCREGTQDAPGCPVFLFPPDVEDAATCHLCGNCLKNCPRGAITAAIVPPTSGLGEIRRPLLSDAVMAATIMGVVLMEQFSMLRLWKPLWEGIGALLGLDPYVWRPLVLGLLLAAFILAPLAALGLASLASRPLAGREPRIAPARSFAAFGYSVVPLALAGQFAHGLAKLLTQSRNVPYALLAIAGRFPESTPAPWLSNSAVFAIEMAVLALGAAASLYVGFRIGRRFTRAAFLPYAFVILSVLAAELYAVAAMLHEMG